MTLPRSQRNVNDVLYGLACDYPGGFEELARRIGSTPQILRKRMGPGTKDRDPTLRDFSMTIEICQGSGVADALEPLHALCWRHRGVFISFEEMGDGSEECILRAATAVMARMGDLAGSVEEALDADEITDQHMEKIEPKFRRAFTAMFGWLARVQGKFKRDKDKPRRPFFRKAMKDQATTEEVRA